MADNNVYPLRTPITFEGNEIREVTLRPLKGRDLLAVEREIKARGGNMAQMGEMESTFHMIARATGQEFEAIEEMAAEDVTTLAQRVSGFL